MYLKKELTRKVSAFQILKPLRAYALLAICCLLPIALSAQTVRISGRVTDSSGEGLVGASVVEKGIISKCTTWSKKIDQYVRHGVKNKNEMNDLE